LVNPSEDNYTTLILIPGQYSSPGKIVNTSLVLKELGFELTGSMAIDFLSGGIKSCVYAKFQTFFCFGIGKFKKRYFHILHFLPLAIGPVS